MTHEVKPGQLYQRCGRNTWTVRVFAVDARYAYVASDAAGSERARHVQLTAFHDNPNRGTGYALIDDTTSPT